VVKTLGQESPVFLPIESLPFVKARVRYLAGNDFTGSQADMASDPTVELLRRWKLQKDKLHDARLKTLQCCEARPGKGDAAFLAVVDQETFSNLQAAIKTHMEQITSLETAIRELDLIGAGFLCNLISQIDGAKSNTQQVHRVYSGWLAAHIKRYPTQSVDEINQMADVKQRAEALEVAKNAEERITRELEPKILAIREILSAVEC
jgi:hypothetical protein